jgi:hypothetical protein
MRAIERALRAELRILPELVASSALARAALVLARRLDEGPGDDTFVKLHRELRMVTADLYARAASGGDAGEVERFLERIARPPLRNTED